MSMRGTHDVNKFSRTWDISSGYHGDRAEGEEISQRGEATGTKRGAAGIISYARFVHVGDHHFLRK